jgi:ipoprotein LpqH
LTLTGCSSDPPDYRPPAGELVAGTAEVTVNGRDAGLTEAVQCNTTEWLTTITTGDTSSGVTALLSNRDRLAAESVGINNVGGFTGSYNAGLGGTAKVTMTDRTYDISGTADGFDTARPSFRAPGTFALRVSC